MGDAAGKGADTLHLLGMAELVLQFFLFRYIVDYLDHGFHRPRVVFYGIRLRLHMGLVAFTIQMSMVEDRGLSRLKGAPAWAVRIQFAARPAHVARYLITVSSDDFFQRQSRLPAVSG